MLAAWENGEEKFSVKKVCSCFVTKKAKGWQECIAILQSCLQYTSLRPSPRFMHRNPY